MVDAYASPNDLEMEVDEPANFRFRDWNRVDFNWITDRVAVGGISYDDATFRKLAKAGFTHVIDCTHREFHRIARGLKAVGIKYLNAYTGDDGQTKDIDWFAPIVEFGLAALDDPNTRLLAHCAAGYNRGPSAGYAILRAQGMSIEDAYYGMKQRRFVGIAYALDAEIALRKLGYVA